MNEYGNYSVCEKPMPAHYDGPKLYEVRGPGIPQFGTNAWSQTDAQAIMRLVGCGHKAGREAMAKDVRELLKVGGK